MGFLFIPKTSFRDPGITTKCSPHQEFERAARSRSLSSGAHARDPLAWLGRTDGQAYALAIRRQCSHAAWIRFSLAWGVRNAECADSVTLGIFVNA